jgi:hypothetical protein
MVWNNNSLASAHASLNASGVATNGKVTFVAADTDHGLAFLALIDQELAEQPPIAQGNLHMDSVAHGSSIAFVNGLSPIAVTQTGFGSQIATGNFSWNSNGGGDAFAWANLLQGNTMTFRFNRIAGQPLALDDPNTFQFVTWTGSGWAIIPLPSNQVSFTASSDFGFAANVTTPTVIPLYPAAMLAALPLMLIPVVRRGRRAAHA